MPSTTNIATNTMSDTPAATMETTNPVITDAIKQELTEWCEIFRRRWVFQPPEFWEVVNLGDFEGHYEKDVGDVVNPIRRGWFADLIKYATAEDLEALEGCVSVVPYLRYFQCYILSRICDGHTTWYSSRIIPWFRAKGWKVEKPSCNCGCYACPGDCGVLVCGCIDMCRGRCGMRDWEERW
jgi:hypothetical protein